MRRLLIVTPSFPPKNSADIHRVRTSLPYYREFGWEPTVLCLTPESTAGPDDPVLAATVPGDIRVVRVRAWDAAKTRRFGFGGNDHRGLAPLYRAGSKLLGEDRHDVVFFSTTAFFTFLLGPLWKRKFGPKIVYDMQDPWHHAQSAYTRANVPGAWWKYQLNRRLSYHLERFALTAADHIVSVSPGYVDTLSARYPQLGRSRFTVIPFGASPADFDLVRARHIAQHIIPDNDRCIRWVYAGRGGPDMFPALDILFGQLAMLRRQDPERWSNVRLHFVGTNYSPPEKTYDVVAPIAARHGVSDIVAEHSTRIPYHETLALCLRSDAILMIGSTEPDYMASKLFQCVLAQKPILALFHARSPVSAAARTMSNVELATFAERPSEPEFAAAVARGLARLLAGEVRASADPAAIAPWTARELTRVQCAVFDALVSKQTATGLVRKGAA
jgi:hypothetical protein